MQTSVLVTSAEYERLNHLVRSLTQQNATYQASCASLLREKSEWERESTALRLFLGAQEEKNKVLEQENQVLRQDRAAEASTFNIKKERLKEEVCVLTIKADKASAELSKEQETSTTLRKQLLECQNENR